MAYRHCRSGVCESDTGVSGLVSYSLAATIGGTSRDLIFHTFDLEETADGQPARLACRVSGFTPAVGQEIVITTDGVNRRLFGGTIMKIRSQIQAEAPVIWDIEAVDYSFLANKDGLVFQEFRNGGANTAVATILDTYTDSAASFRPGYVSQDLGNFSASFSGVTVTEAIDEIASQVGAFWFITPKKRVYMFTTFPSGHNGRSITNSSDIERVTYSESITQTRNRVIAEGAGPQTSAVVASTDTVVSVDDTAGFSVTDVTSPMLRIGPEVYNYTSVSAGSGPGTIQLDPGANTHHPQGETVWFHSQQDDAAEQTAMATTLGGGLAGVIVARVSTGDVMSSFAAQELASADLSLYKTPLKTLSFLEDNPHMVPGMTVVSTITSPITISGTYRIQRIQTILRGYVSSRDESGSSLELTRVLFLRPAKQVRMRNLLG